MNEFARNGSFEERIHTAKFLMSIPQPDHETNEYGLIICDAFKLLTDVPHDVKHIAVTIPRLNMDASTLIMAAIRRYHKLETLVLHPLCPINALVLKSLPPTLRYADLVFEQPSRAQQFPDEAFAHLVNLEYLKLPLLDSHTTSRLLIPLTKLKHLYLHGPLVLNIHSPHLFAASTYPIPPHIKVYSPQSIYIGTHKEEEKQADS